MLWASAVSVYVVVFVGSVAMVLKRRVAMVLLCSSKVVSSVELSCQVRLID